MRLAPNGKPSNLTPEQYALVRTPAFKRWFGDWENSPETASKFVDRNGEPLVVYRGNRERLGYEFTLGHNLLGKDTINNFGHFFTPDKFIAERYAEDFMQNDKGYILEVFLNAKKVLDLKGLLFRAFNENFIQALESKGVNFSGFNELKKGILNYEWTIDKIDGTKSTPTIYDYFDFFPSLRELFIKNGFEGVEFLEQSRGGGITYVVFNSNQIKMADGSNTTFDGGSPDIRYKQGGNTDYKTGLKDKEIYSKKVRAKNLQLTKELAKLNSPINKQKKIVISKYGEFEDAWLENDEDVIKLRDLIKQRSDLRQEKRKFTNKNIEELKKLGYTDWVVKDYKTNLLVDWSSYDAEGKAEGLTGTERIIAIGNKTFLKSIIEKTEHREEYTYHIQDSKTKPNLWVLVETWQGYYLKKGGYVRLAKTPAPKSERIYGSKTNKPKSSASSSSAKSIKFSEDTLQKIKNKVAEHNEKYPNKKITVAVAKAVVRRGMGAYSSTHRPTIKGGKPNSRVAWGLARLNAFTYKAVHGKSKSGKYNQDDDLFNELGMRVKDYENGGKISTFAYTIGGL